MYTALKKLKVREDPKQGLFQFLIKTPFLMGWYLLRLVTSVPRQVILDSYEWSGRFRTKEDLNNWQFLLANGVCSVNMVLELGPVWYKRIHYLEGKRWNFNPNY